MRTFVANKRCCDSAKEREKTMTKSIVCVHISVDNIIRQECWQLTFLGCELWDILLYSTLLQETSGNLYVM